MLDFQAFCGLGTTKFIVKEVSIVDLDTLAEHSFLFKPPKDIPKDAGRSYSDVWLKKHHHHLEWSQGHIDYSMLEEVLTKYTKKFKFLFAKGVEKCVFLEDLLRKFVYDLELFGCPNLKKLALSVECDKCPHHAGKRYVCAHLQTKGLSQWAIKNRDKIDLHDPAVRLATYTHWSVLMDPSRLSFQGYVRIRGSRLGIRCVYCDLEIFKIDPSENPQKEHRKLCPDCPSFSKSKE